MRVRVDITLSFLKFSNQFTNMNENLPVIRLAMFDPETQARMSRCQYRKKWVKYKPIGKNVSRGKFMYRNFSLCTCACTPVPGTWWVARVASQCQDLTAQEWLCNAAICKFVSVLTYVLCRWLACLQWKFSVLQRWVRLSILIPLVYSNGGDLW